MVPQAERWVINYKCCCTGSLLVSAYSLALRIRTWWKLFVLSSTFLKGLFFFFLFHTSCDIKGWHMGCIVMVKSVSLGSLIDRSWHHSELTPPPQTWWLFDPQPFTAPHRNTSWSLIGRHEAWSYCRIHQCCFWLGLDLDWESRLFSCLEDLFASQDWRWRLQWIKVESSWTLPMLPR